MGSLNCFDTFEVARLLRQSHLRGREPRGRRGRAKADSYLPEEDRLLGTLPDAEVARQIGRTLNAVRKRRRRLGIALVRAVRRRRDWLPEEDTLLGTAPDTEIARRLGRSYGSVQCRRLDLHIPPFFSQFCNWTAEADAWFDSLSDAEIALRSGRSLPAVRARRRHLHPEAFPPRLPPAKGWKASEIALLGTQTDPEVARQIGRTPAAVQHKRLKLGLTRPHSSRSGLVWTEEKQAMLRTSSDRQLARLWHCSAGFLRKARRQFGIPPLKRDLRWTPPEDRLIRRFNNRTVAERTGRTLAAINERRQVLGAPHSWDLPGLPRLPRERKHP